MEPIHIKINRFYDLIENYTAGAEDTRYKSWEWCHATFLEARNKRDKGVDIDYLSLHLAFYLASWGMYRGSSFLLQRDYRTHYNAVKILMDKQYDELWDFKPNIDNIESTKNQLFNNDNDETLGLYWKIKKSYANNNNTDDTASDTLTTKILMGTLACIPAFDRFLKRGIAALNNTADDMHIARRIFQSIEGRNCEQNFESICRFIINNENEFCYNSFHVADKEEYYYPPMKLLDMFLWEIGYELDTADSFEEQNEHKKEAILESFRRRLGIELTNDNFCREIRRLNS